MTSVRNAPGPSGGVALSDLLGSADYVDPMPQDFPRGGYGELYCPWCGSVLITAPDLDVQAAAVGHRDEYGHTGRPSRINEALHLASLSRTYAAD